MAQRGEDDLILDDPPLAEDGGRPDDRVDDERHDEDNRLKPEFVRRVREALEDEADDDHEEDEDVEEVRQLRQQGYSHLL